MEAGQMIKVCAHKGEGFSVVAEYGSWKVGTLRYSERFARLGEMERHMLTDEVFILTEGNATLYTETEALSMERNVAYTVPAAVWHHIVVDESATVIVIENRNTSKENTEKKYFDKKENR